MVEVRPELLEQLRDAGAYDPDAPWADRRRQLIAMLLDLGASDDELVQWADELPGMTMLLALWPGRERLTRAEVAERAGVSEEVVSRFLRTAGLPDPGSGVAAASEADVEAVELGQAAMALFGEDAVMQLTRVTGASLARIADAVVSAFLTNVELGLEHDPSGLTVGQANLAAAELFPAFARLVDTMLRRHLIAARRSLLALESDASGFEVRPLAVGFVDLVGSTAFAQQHSLATLGSALAEFENVAADTVHDGGGRLVKLIGDEIMFHAPERDAAAGIARGLLAAFRDHDVLPPVRGGLAHGPVMTRDGDCYGPVVNLAARAAKLAEPGEVLAAFRVDGAVPRGCHRVRGFDDEVELFGLG